MLTIKDYAITNNPKGLPHFANEPGVKKAYTEEPYFQWELDEYKKCKASFEHFCEEWCMIETGKGKKKFKLYPYQKRAISTIQENRFIIGLAPRQMGKSQLMAAYILWFVLFHSSKKVYVTSKDIAGTKDIVDRVTAMFRQLPFFLQAGAISFNVKSFKLDNGSALETGSSKPQSARGISGDLIFSDEFAFLPQATEFYTAIYPIITGKEDSSAKIVIMSTPNGVGNQYHQLWKDASEKRNFFKAVRWRWDERPGRDEKFKMETIANVGDMRWRQEFECDFVGSSNTLIDPSTLEKLNSIQPIYTSVNREVRVYADPVPGNRYVLAVDVATGIGLDYSAFHVIDVTTKPYKQVMVYSSNTISPHVYHMPILSWAKKYNNAYVIVENNNQGLITCTNILEEEYENFYYSPPKSGRTVIGLTTTTKTKSEGVSKLKELVETNLLEINDIDTITEFMYFERLKTSYGASNGKHDDLVMALVIFAYLTHADPIFKEIESNDLPIDKAIQRAREAQIDKTTVPIPYMFHGDEWDDDPPCAWTVF